MIRTCPRCGDFYADGALLFCPADGMPLADLDPQGETWAEAARVVGEKGRVLRRRTRRLRMRRVVTTAVTVLITTLVVCVIVANTYVYLVPPQPDAPAVASALKPAPTPTPRPSETPTPIPTATPDTTSLPFVPAVTPTPTPEATPTPDRVRNPVGPSNPGDTSTPTPTPTATPAVTETPTIREEPPRSPTPTPTPTPDRRRELIAPDPSRPPGQPAEPEPAPAPDPAPEPAPQCTDDDRQRLKGELVAKYQAAWEKAIKEERYAIARQYAPRRATNPKAKVSKPITYEVEFSGACVPVSVKATFKWRISWEAPPFDACGKKMDGKKTFACGKGAAEWRCG